MAGLPLSSASPLSLPPLLICSGKLRAPSSLVSLPAEHPPTTFSLLGTLFFKVSSRLTPWGSFREH